VAVRQQSDQHTFNDGILADHGLADFITEFLGPTWTSNHEKEESTLKMDLDLTRQRKKSFPQKKTHRHGFTNSNPRLFCRIGAFCVPKRAKMRATPRFRA
jgi:hypothetical protein